MRYLDIALFRAACPQSTKILRGCRREHVAKKPIPRLLMVGVRVLVVGLGLFVAVWLVSQNDAPDTGRSDRITNDRTSNDPLDMASVAFEGSPSASSIKSRLDQAFVYFNLPQADDSYSRASSSLIVLRQRGQDRGCDECTEMAVLSHMLRSSGWEVGMDFPEAAAWSVEAMIAGDQ